MESYEFEQVIIDLITLKQEGGYWDFKREWYHANSDLLHDIICMANNLESRDAYIIIGIDEESDYAVVDVAKDEYRKNTQQIVDFLRNKKFAGGIRPTVYIHPLYLQGQTIDVVVVKNDYDTPFYLTESYQGVFANNIYVRMMDTNTPKTASADRIHIEYLWRKHFRLDASPIDRVLHYLTLRKDWLNAHSETSSIEYYKYYPEYTIEHSSVGEDRDGYEYYLFNQTDRTPHWYDIVIRFHQTIIASLGGSALDGGRYFTSTPETGGIRFSQGSLDCYIYYKYFINGTLEYIVHCYYYKDDEDEARYSHDRFLECVLVFGTKREKEEFEWYVLSHQDQFVDLTQRVHLPYFPNLDGYNMSAFKREYSNACALKEMLNNFMNDVVNS